MFLYHVVRDKIVKIGDEFETSNEYNFFAQRLFGKDFAVAGIDLNQMIFSVGIENFDKEKVELFKSYVYERCAIIRELVFEDYRQKNCPELPSRLKCRFGCETLEDAEKWVPILQRMCKNENTIKIVKLECEGEIFSGDGDLILRNTNSVISKYELAKNYWTKKENIKFPEILFIGRAKVVEICD